jgi:alpha/beta superfamily hydrolase
LGPRGCSAFQIGVNPVLVPIATADDFLQVGVGDRLSQVMVEPGRPRSFARPILTEPGKRDETDVIQPGVLSNAPGQLVPVHARHRQVDQREITVPAFGQARAEERPGWRHVSGREWDCRVPGKLRRFVRSRVAVGATVAAIVLGSVIVRSMFQAPAVRSMDEKSLREYAGVYQWGPKAFAYLQMWEEFSGFGKPTLVAFDESGEVRTLYPTDRGQFFAGPGAADATSIESRIEFQRDATGNIASLTWAREGTPARTARLVDIERREDLRFSNGDVQLAGTLISPATPGPHPAVILVHESGAENREHLLPFARFLIRHGMAVLGYDKRGVGGSTGDWNKASFDDLAGDVVAAFEYLKTRSDIQRAQIGMLGWSQAGWVMPVAATRAKDLAFLITISGAGISGRETTIDQARNEMIANGMKPQVVDQIVELSAISSQPSALSHQLDQRSLPRAES